MSIGKFGPGHPYGRQRRQGGIDLRPTNYSETAFNGTVTDYGAQTTNAQMIGDRRITNDVVTPGYRSLIQKGYIINHGYNSKRVVRASSYAGYHAQRNSGSGSTTKTYLSLNGYYNTPPFYDESSRPLGVPLRALMTEAGTEAKAGVNSPDVQGQVEIAEARKLLDTFKFRTGNLNRYLEQMMRNRRTLIGKVGITAKELAGVISSNWLRYRYGIMPMVYTLEDLSVGEAVRLTRATSKGRASWSNFGGQDLPMNTSAFFYNTVYSEEWQYDVEVRAGILYRTAVTYDRYGMSPRNIFDTAWELVPYSFVVDWFANTGTWIRAQTASIGVKQLASWTVVRERYFRAASLEATWKSPSGFTNIQTPQGGHSCLVELTTRNPGVSIGLVLRRESIQNIPHDKRAGDIVALAFQNFQRLMASYR